MFPAQFIARIGRLLRLILIVSSSVNAGLVNAAWFESSGQAAIIDGNIQQARQQATQEAIKQALLFAGASVTSVQKMANGVLHDDALEIRATGEVNHIELIDEVHANGIITVSVRADIFSQQASCNASDYIKTIATTWSPLVNRMQATTGHLFDFGQVLPRQLHLNFERFAQHSALTQVVPLYHDIALHKQRVQDVTLIAQQANSQYVLLAEIDDISVLKPDTPDWQFWDDAQPLRQFGYHVGLYDGQTGALLWQQQYNVSAPWQFDLHAQVDVYANELWRSAYGRAIDSVMQDIAQQVDEKLACLPAYGRVLQVNNEQLTINLGQEHGMQVGDELTLFQVKQFYDHKGNLFSQYHLHPGSVTIKAISPNSAIAVSADGTYLANIQPNDFVSRR